MSDINKILVAIDFSESSHFCLERAFMIGDAKELLAFHVLSNSSLEKIKKILGIKENDFLYDISKNKLKELVQGLNGEQVNVKYEVEKGSISQTIIEKSKRFDLMIIGACERGFTKELPLGTKARILLHQSKKPMLVVKNRPANHYENILIATDYSDCSLRALQYTAKLFPKAKLHLINVFEHPAKKMMAYANVSTEMIAEYEQKEKENSEWEMNDFIKKSALNISKNNIVMTSGHTNTEIIKNMKKLNIDLLVLGKQGKSAVENLLLGSTTLSLLGQVSVDTLVVS